MKILKMNRQESKVTDLSNSFPKRQFQVIGIFVFFLLLFTGPPALKAQTTVNVGDDLSATINNLTSGETIILNPGTYDPIIIQGKKFTATNPLILKAAGDGVLIKRSVNTQETQNPNGQSYDAAVFIECSYIAIEGIEFVGGDRGVTVHRSDHIIFRDCDITQTLEAGVKVENNSEYIDFIDCLFAYTGLGDSERFKYPSFGEAIYVGRGSYKNWGQWPDATKYVWIEGCEFHHTGRGEAINIKAEAFHCTVRNNDIHDIHLNTYDFDQTNSGAISLDHNLGYQGTTYREGERRENWVENNRITTIRSGIQPWEPNMDQNSSSRKRIAGIYSAGTGNNIVGNTITDVSNGALTEEANGIRFNHWSNDITKNIIWNNEVTNVEDGDDFGDLPNSSENLAIEQNPGSNPNNPQSWYPVGGSSNSLSWTTPPTDISNGDNTVTLDYSIDQNGVVLVQLYDANWNYIGQTYQNVSAGASQSSLNLNVSGLSTGDYVLQAELRNSSWGDIGVERLREWVTFSGTPPPSGNLLSWDTPPTDISNGDNTVTLNYSIDQNGVVLVQLYDANWNYIGQTYENISAGTGQSTLTLEADGLSAGDYLIQVELRNSSWGNIDVDRLREWVPFNGTTPISGNSVSFNPSPTSISNGNNPITLDYSIDQAGIVVVQLYSGWNYIKQVYENVSAGTGTLTLPLNVSGLSAGNYRIQAELRNTSWSVIDGTQIRQDVAFSNNKMVSDLSQNIQLSPNPANNNIQLTCELSENTQAQIQVHDTFGKLVKHITNVELIADSPIEMEVSQLPAGVYFCNIQSDKWQAVKKFVIAR